MGYLLSILIGILLGLIGAGGSILTIPVLVYVVGIPATTATSYSLFIVGTTSLVGAWKYWRHGLLHMQTALLFALPSVIFILLVRELLLPALPEVVLEIHHVIFTKDAFLMMLFAVFMLLASFNMIRTVNINCDNNDLSKLEFSYRFIVFEGMIVGLVTGLLGVGGGFLIVPALVLLANLPIRFAVGTSLLIIAINSLIGFAGDMAHLVNIEWFFLAIYTSLAIAGLFIGGKISRFIQPTQLKIYFGWFILVMAIVILIKETFI